MFTLIFTGMYGLLDWAGGKYVELPPSLSEELTMTVFEYVQMLVKPGKSRLVERCNRDII